MHRCPYCHIPLTSLGQLGAHLGTYDGCPNRQPPDEQSDSQPGRSNHDET